MIRITIRKMLRKNPELAHALFRKSYNLNYLIPAESLVSLVEMGLTNKGKINPNVLTCVKENLKLNEKEELIMIK